jgi:hypothetical protein
MANYSKTIVCSKTRSEITESYGGAMLHFLSDLHNVFHAILRFHQECIRISVLLHLHQHL